MEDAQDFYQFIHEVILPHEPPGFKPHSKFHRALVYAACQPLSVTAAPRGFLKSTIFSRYRPLHRLAQNKPPASCGNIDYMLLSETDSLAKSHLAWVTHHLETNPVLISRYGTQRPSDSERRTWNQKEILLNNGAHAISLGYGSQIRSRHPTDIIVDDLESHENMSTPEKLERLKDWFYRTLMGAMIPETRMTVIGTIIERLSLLTELLQKEEFHGKLWKALNTDTAGNYTSLWSDRWPVDLLLKRKKLLGTHRFEAEYQNNPIGPADPIIWREWVRRHTELDLTNLKVVRRYIACDPAFTEERWGDYSAIVVLDETPNGLLYERLAWRKKVASPELIKTLMNFYYHFRQEVPDIHFAIEEVQAQKVIRQGINELDPSIAIIPMRPDKDKARRLIDVSRYFEAGVVSLKTEALVEELLDFPKGDKDRVDALVYALKVYEQNHPTLADGKHSELDILKELDQDSLGFYLERASTLADQETPTLKVPTTYLKRYHEAMAISDFIEEMM